MKNIREQALEAYRISRQEQQRSTRLVDAISEVFTKTLSFVPDSIIMTERGDIKIVVADCDFSATIVGNKINFYYKGVYPVNTLAELGKYLSEEMDAIKSNN